MKTGFKTFMCAYSRLIATLMLLAISIGSLLWLAITEHGHQILWSLLALITTLEPYILVLTIFVFVPLGITIADEPAVATDSRETRECIDRYIRNLKPNPGQELCSCRRLPYLHARRWW